MTQSRTDLITNEVQPTKPISHQVIESVADANGVDPTDLDVRLYDVVDPDALDHLFRTELNGGSPPNGQVTFTLAGCEVVVTSTGNVTVTRHESVVRG